MNRDAGLTEGAVAEVAGQFAAEGGHAPGVSTSELRDLRAKIFEVMGADDMVVLRECLPRYGAALEALARRSECDPLETERIETEHRMFFEQVKASLVTSRIQLRLELERVKASRRYSRESQERTAAGWEG